MTAILYAVLIFHYYIRHIIIAFRVTRVCDQYKLCDSGNHKNENA